MVKFGWLKNCLPNKIKIFNYSKRRSKKNKYSLVNKFLKETNMSTEVKRE